MKSWIQRLGPAIVVMGLIFIASATPGSDIPKFGALDTLAKKGAHMLGYALLAAAYFYALTYRKSISRLQFVVAAFLVILYSISDEWHQSFTPGRNPAFLDVCIDTAGGLIGLTVWYLIQTRLHRMMNVNK